jgi:cbb3-type cytochrome oxidase maturation protein
MTALLILIPVALFLGGLGLIAFLWTLKSGQYDDLEGAAARILLDDDALPGPKDDRARGSERHG